MQLTEEPPDTEVCATGSGFCFGNFWKLWVQSFHTWKTEKPERVPEAAKWWGDLHECEPEGAPGPPNKLDLTSAQGDWSLPCIWIPCFNREGQVLSKPVLKWCLYKSDPEHSQQPRHLILLEYYKGFCISLHMNSKLVDASKFS